MSVMMVNPLPSVIGDKSRVLVVDDEVALLRAVVRSLTAAGYLVDSAPDGRAAINLVRSGAYDLIVSDISMPGMDGIRLLREVREHDLDVPIILMTGSPTVESAVEAVERGALRYLIKPVELKQLLEAVHQAVRLRKLAGLKRQALEMFGDQNKLVGDRAGLEATFTSALSSLWMAYQPIVSWSDRSVFAYEALVRTREPSIPHPGALIDAAERLGRLNQLGRTIRDRVAGDYTATTNSGARNALMFVNLHARDLLDNALFSADAPLTAHASRVVLEITERTSLDEVSDIRGKIRRLRKMGFRIAVDDLGAGYAGLTSFALLEPDVVKLDMSLVRNAHKEPMKQKLMQSMIGVCRELGMMVVGEGVESREECRVLTDLGCDLLQGYLFARPGPPFPEAFWGASMRPPSS